MILKRSLLHNKYDFFIVTLIGGLAFGCLGGALQVSRVIGIIFLPYALKFMFRQTSAFIKSPVSFVIISLFFISSSLLWSSNIGRGFEELLYYIIHFALFLEIIIFSKYASNAVLDISIGWLIAFLLTSVVAFWELQTGQHLSSSFHDEISMSQGNGIVLDFKFAAATFTNYNDYETFMCYCFPFLIFLFNNLKKNIQKVGVIFVMVTLLYIIINNASRGAIISISIMLLVNFICHSKSLKSFMKVFLVSLAGAALFVFVFQDVFVNILFRLGNTTMFEGNTRTEIWVRGIECLKGTYFMGTGAGALYETMAIYSSGGDVLALHNMFMELLVTFGVIYFIIFLIPFLSMCKHSFNAPTALRPTLLCIIFPIPFYYIINSTYLLSPSLFLFMASFYVFAYGSKYIQVNN